MINQVLLTPNDGIILPLTVGVILLGDLIHKAFKRRQQTQQERSLALAKERLRLSRTEEEKVEKRHALEQRQAEIRENPRTPDAFAELKLMRARANDIPDLPLDAPRWITRSAPLLGDDHRAHDKAA